MAQFVMEGRDHAARAESEFVLGFIEAMFFTCCEPAATSDIWFDPEVVAQRESGQLGELPDDVGYTDIHPDSLAAIRRDCEAWQATNADLLSQAYARGYSQTQAGIDYWLTRNGHGVGFWDRAELAEDGLGDKLTDACLYDEFNAWFGDHVTYGNAPFVHVDLRA